MRNFWGRGPIPSNLGSDHDVAAFLYKEIHSRNNLTGRILPRGAGHRRAAFALRRESDTLFQRLFSIHSSKEDL